MFLHLTTIFIVIRFLKNKEITLRYNKPLLIFTGLWLISLTLSTIFSIAPSLSFWGSYDRVQGFISHLAYVFLFLIFLNVLKGKKEQEVFLKNLLAVSFVVSLHAIIQQFGIGIFAKGAMEEFLGRSFAAFGHPNFLGQFLLFPIWVGIYFLIASKRKILVSFIVLPVVFALFLSENRASILGLVISAIFYVLLTLNFKKHYKYLAVSSLALSFAGFILFFAPSLRSLSSRFYLWEGSLKIFPDHPLIGSGLETFKLVFQKVTSAALFDLEQLYSIADRAHNEYLDILVTQGIFGLTVWLSIIFGVFYLAFRKRKLLIKNKLLATCLSAFIAILVSNFFGFSLTTHYVVLGLLLAVLLNNLLKIKFKKIHLGLLTACISGILLTFSVFGIFTA